VANITQNITKEHAMIWAIESALADSDTYQLPFKVSEDDNNISPFSKEK
jgi:hypothetical protein